MCDGGRVAQYLEALAPLETTTILFAGYVSPSTNGGKLLSLQKIPLAERAQIHGDLVWESANGPGEPIVVPVRDVKAHIERITGYSGHADQPSLLSWLFPKHKERQLLAGRTIFITHGVDQARRELRSAIEARATELAAADPSFVAPKAMAPTKRDPWFDLDPGQWVVGQEPAVVAMEPATRIAELERRLEEALTRLAVVEQRLGV